MNHLKINIDPVISGRIKAAWAKLTPAQRAELAPLFSKAHEQAVEFSRTKRAPAGFAAPHSFMLAQTVLTDDQDNVVNSLEAGVVLDVGADGVMWGTGKYQQLDPGWTEALAVFLETMIGGKRPFIDNPATVSIPDVVHIGLVGDWGTGNWRGIANPAPSTRVMQQLSKLQPPIMIHLGDVYYAGTSPQEEHNLINIWPKSSIGSFALNSNHEMYSGAANYFHAITNQPFGMQNGCSFFALENKNWVIVGLDSAYFSPEAGLYMDGALGPPGGVTQLNFLKAQVAKGKKVVVLTHHNGLSEDGLSTTNLWNEVMSAFGAGPALWYWGHAHAGAVYKPFGPAKIPARCCGHGALPWGQASSLKNNNVEWYEQRSANDPDIKERVLNGFTVVSLDGSNAQETFYDENGGVAWRFP